jgi:hypothetical protein
MKSRRPDAEGEQIKLTAETETERASWIKAIQKTIETMPKEDPEDDEYRKLSIVVLLLFSMDVNKIANFNFDFVQAKHLKRSLES